MSQIEEALVLTVVTEVGERMKEPTYAQLAVGALAEAHPDIGRYITAHLDELGSGEAVIHGVFHAEILNECYRRHRGRHLPAIGFPALDRAATPDAMGSLARRQPAIASYLVSNLDEEPLRRVLALVALAMDDAR